MKNKTIMILCLISFAMLSMIRIHAQEVKKEEIQLPAFTAVDFGIAADVQLRQGSEQKLVIEGESDLLDEIEALVSGKSLKIKYKRTVFGSRQNNVVIYITMPVIDGLTISGSTRLEAKTPVKTETISFVISGSGAIKIPDFQAREVKTRISGSGSIEVGGDIPVRFSDVSISGSGSYNASGLQTENASISISGSGTCRVHVTDELEGRVSGSGVIYYNGRPVVNARVSGSGKILKAK
jgi:hypothetical protein